MYKDIHFTFLIYSWENITHLSRTWHQHCSHFIYTIFVFFVDSYISVKKCCSCTNYRNYLDSFWLNSIALKYMKMTHNLLSLTKIYKMKAKLQKLFLFVFLLIYIMKSMCMKLKHVWLDDEVNDDHLCLYSIFSI